MKRMLAVAIAAVFTVAFAVSAIAEVKVSGEYRLRMESWDNTNLTASKNDTPASNDNGAQYGQRIRLSVDATPTDDVAVKVTLQDTDIWGDTGLMTGSAPTNNLTGLESNGLVVLHEGYIVVKNIFGTPISVKAGRQEINLGDQRQIGSFGWSNFGRGFDALALTYSNESVNLLVADVKLAENNDGNSWTATSAGTLGGTALAPGDSGNDIDAYVIYATVKTIPNNVLDLYYISIQDGTGAMIGGTGGFKNGSGGSSELNTLGFRFAGANSGIDYSLEYATQNGKAEGYVTKNNKVSGASAYAAKAGYTLPGENKIRIGAEYDYASGDKNGAADNKIKTYQQIRPTNHDKYGYADLQGWMNLKAINVNVSGNIDEKLSARFDYWQFALDKKGDGWYSAVGTATGTRAGAVTASDKVGTEYDLTFGYKYNAALNLSLGASMFTPGKFVKDKLGANKADDFTWMHIMATAKF